MSVMLPRRKAVFWTLCLATITFATAMPHSLNTDERKIVLEEMKELSSFINLINIPEDDTPKGSLDEDEDGSAEAANAQCRDEIEQKNATVNESQSKPDLIHANFDSLCNLTDNESVKKLPTYLVGWELKKYCGEINTIPYKRFRMEEYKTKQPRFDIPGMCIPLKGKEMTLLMIDPDAPSKNSHRCRSWLHWMVVNIQKGNIRNGREIMSYQPPMPSYRSGPHRYFFLLYEQNHHIDKVDDSENNLAERCGFNVRNFAEDNSLVGPIALNMFLTERKSRKDDIPDEVKEKQKNKSKEDAKGQENKEDSDKENDKEKSKDKEQGKKEADSDTGQKGKKEDMKEDTKKDNKDEANNSKNTSSEKKDEVNNSKNTSTEEKDEVKNLNSVSIEDKDGVKDMKSIDIDNKYEVKNVTNTTTENGDEMKNATNKIKENENGLRNMTNAIQENKGVMDNMMNTANESGLRTVTNTTKESKDVFLNVANTTRETNNETRYMKNINIGPKIK